MIQIGLIFFVALQLGLLISLRASCGLLKLHRWVLGGKLVMGKKLSFGKTIGKVIQVCPFSTGISTF
jgi:hypothetical protein